MSDFNILPIPHLLTNAGSFLAEIDLKNFINTASDDDFTGWHFALYVAGKLPLPKSLVFSPDATLSGVVASDAVGSYNLVFEVTDNTGTQLSREFRLVIQSADVAENDIIEDVQQKLAALVGADPSNFGIATLPAMHNWETTPLQAYYLAERFAYLAVWNAADHSGPGTPKVLTLPGASKHYRVYDFGVCVVAEPIDLYNSARTARDAFITARAVADEVYKRRWAIEFSGFDKMVGAAWVRLQQLGAQHGNPVEILNYIPRKQDEKLCLSMPGSSSPDFT